MTDCFEMPKIKSLKHLNFLIHSFRETDCELAQQIVAQVPVYSNVTCDVDFSKGDPTIFEVNKAVQLICNVCGGFGLFIGSALFYERICRDAAFKNSGIKLGCIRPGKAELEPLEWLVNHEGVFTPREKKARIKAKESEIFYGYRQIINVDAVIAFSDDTTSLIYGVYACHEMKLWYGRIPKIILIGDSRSAEFCGSLGIFTISASQLASSDFKSKKVLITSGKNTLQWNIQALEKTFLKPDWHKYYFISDERICINIREHREKIASMYHG